MPMGPERKNNRANWLKRRGTTTERAARLKLIGGLVACAIVLIAVSLVTNAAFTGKPGSPPVSVTAPDRLRQFDQLGEYLTAALASVDQLVSMLTTGSLVSCASWGWLKQSTRRKSETLGGADRHR